MPGQNAHRQVLFDTRCQDVVAARYEVSVKLAARCPTRKGRQV